MRRAPGDKPLSELVMVMLPAHICVTRHQRQWVKRFRNVLKPAECPWWRHQMETFSALLAICAGNSPVPVNSPHKGQLHGALMFSLICVWINDWVNNREAGFFRRYRAHYDVSLIVLHGYVITWLILCGDVITHLGLHRRYNWSWHGWLIPSDISYGWNY